MKRAGRRAPTASCLEEGGRFADATQGKPADSSLPWWWWVVPDQLLVAPVVAALLGGAGAVLLIRTQRTLVGTVALLVWLLGLSCSAIFATRRKYVSIGFAVALVLISVSLAVGACFVS